MAAEVDRLLAVEFKQYGVEPAGLTRDEDFLRRAMLDLAGTIPTANDVTQFGLDPDPEKRAKRIASLLESDDYSRTWAGYLREVIFSRATETRARAIQRDFEGWLVEQLAANRHWDDLTTDLLTATGELTEAPAGALIFAHTGKPEELAGEVSRIFLGIQLQCANCHDHPYDAWKREQFHELAAYFPRVTVRQELQERPPVFTVASTSFPAARMMLQDVDPERGFRFMDRNRDGKLVKSETGQRGPLAQRFDRVLENFDADKDGGLSQEEYMASVEALQNLPGRGSPEYYMPDLNNPTARGTLIEPKFFVDGSGLARGADDLERRRALAKSITDPKNPWFARAFVNRVWTELLGEGFYNPVDDIGPERSCDYESVLAALAGGFVAADYDIRWLFETIARTDAYQRQLGGRQAGEISPAFAAAVPVRLNSDKIYNSTPRTGNGAVERGLQREYGTCGAQRSAAVPTGLRRCRPGPVPVLQFVQLRPVDSTGRDPRQRAAGSLHDELTVPRRGD
ncbi:MAG: DUF1549 domain-containing protein [Planctomycetaceae bacterium]